MAGQPVTKSYELPDGTMIDLPHERYSWTESLFQPSLHHADSRKALGVHQCIFESIKKSDVDIHRDLYGSIVLSGGTTMLPGFPERVENELKRLAPRGMEVNVIAPPHRDLSVWMGGSKVAGLAAFRQRWCISKSEYDEDPQIVERKMRAWSL